MILTTVGGITIFFPKNFSPKTRAKKMRPKDSAKDLAKLCAHTQPEIRSGAAQTSFEFSGDSEGKNLLVSGGVHLGLARLVSLSRDADEDTIGSAKGSTVELALKALTNLTGNVRDDKHDGNVDDADGRDVIQSLLRQQPPLIASLIERLRDDERGGRGAAVMLLVNLTRISSLKPLRRSITDDNNEIDNLGNTNDGKSNEKADILNKKGEEIVAESDGCSQLLMDGGFGLRRLVQLLLQSVKTGSVDEFEHAALVLANASQIESARAILLSPERRLLPSLLPLLQSPSDARRRGIAFLIRNCVLDASVERITYLLSESIQLVTTILIPLSGDASLYRADEREAMPAVIAGFDSEKKRERDVLSRRALVESLRVLAGRSKEAREHMRAIKVYPVIRAFHEWLETDAQKDIVIIPSVKDDNVADGGIAEKSREEDTPLGEDDERCVEAINVLVQQLWREDEVIAPPPGPLKLEKQRPRRNNGGGAGGGGDVFQEREEPLITMPTVALDKAHEIAKRVANNPSLSDDEVAAWNSKTEATRKALESLDTFV
jgi:hypothetical protein